jgi:DNA-binding MarR family transcriptional regulator
MTNAIAPDTTEVAAHLRLAVTRLARKLRRETEGGLSPSMLSALASVERHGPVTIGELCAHEQVSGPTMTRIVANLAEAGFLSRDVDLGDRRVAWVSITADGLKVLSRARRRKEAYLAKRLRAFSPEELDLLDRASSLLDGIAESR